MSGIYVPWLADAARLTGYPVAEVSGWKSRGHGGMTSVEGVVCHHTAGPKTGEYPSLQVVRDGRAGLPGPLANLGLGRSGTVYVMAAGLAYHAGVSAWAGYSDLNYRFLGIEAEDDGDGVWTAEQLDCYPRLVAALLYYMRRNASRACAHRECALPLGRKPDPTGIDMPAFRARVGQLLADPLHLIPRGGGGSAPAAAPALRQEDDVMYIKCDLDGKGTIGTAIWSGSIFAGLTGGSVASADDNISKGALVQWVSRDEWADLDRKSHALCDNPRPVTIVEPKAQS
ncbi:N-acetylmuramoyl-L-alanine amidase [Pseudonocardia sp. D17]|uniref:N-acetylmuramoyl-L-alanine amidase n=1 Tax=Pseudonocardia sp. D17 TaxID=882661 RepID=UPI002B3FE267|nr:hypothetical protein PSD17_55580 [Pseudonocardia sp. D17]